MIYGGFTSKRGVSWNYSIGIHGWVTQYHGTSMRVTGGWKQGPDAFARKITQECFDAIYARFEFLRDPDHDNTVIITDLSQDVCVKLFQNNYKDTATISKTPEGRFRLVSYFCGDKEAISFIRTFDSAEIAEEYLMGRFSHWEVTA